MVSRQFYFFLRFYVLFRFFCYLCAICASVSLSKVRDIFNRTPYCEIHRPLATCYLHFPQPPTPPPPPTPVQGNVCKAVPGGEGGGDSTKRKGELTIFTILHSIT